MAAFFFNPVEYCTNHRPLIMTFCNCYYFTFHTNAALPVSFIDCPLDSLSLYVFSDSVYDALIALTILTDSEYSSLLQSISVMSVMPYTESSIALMSTPYILHGNSNVSIYYAYNTHLLADSIYPHSAL